MASPASPRVEIFLDGSNFYNGLRLQFGSGRYSVQKLVDKLLQGRPLVRLNFYTGEVDPGREARNAESQRRFLDALRHLSFAVRIFTWPMQYPPSWPKERPQEKGVDAMIVQDLIVGAIDQRYDAAVLLSGDRDFLHVVRLIHERFAVPLETYFPISRCHLYDAARDCFTHAEVITKVFYEAIR